VELKVPSITGILVDTLSLDANSGGCSWMFFDLPLVSRRKQLE
jgi:hypothetical protein